MLSKTDHCRLQNLLADAISLLCRNGVPFRTVHRIDALIGITLDDNEVVLINVNESQLNNANIESDSTLDSTKESIDSHLLCPESNLPSHQNKPETGKVCDTDGNWNMPEGTCTVSKSNLVEVSDFVSGSSVDMLSKVSQSRQQSVELPRGSDERVKSASTLLRVNFEPSAASNSDGLLEDSCVSIKTEQTSESADEVQENSVEANYADVDSLITTDSTSRDLSYPFQPFVWPSWPNRTAMQPKASEASLSVPYRFTRRYPSHHGVLCQSTDLGPANQGTSERHNCHMCGAGLCSPQALRDHIRGTHFSLHSYVCVDCGLTFKWRSTLRTHRFSCPKMTHNPASS